MDDLRGEYSAGLETTVGMWQMLGDLLVGEKVPESISSAISSLAQGTAFLQSTTNHHARPKYCILLDRAYKSGQSVIATDANVVAFTSVDKEKREARFTSVSDASRIIRSIAISDRPYGAALVVIGHDGVNMPITTNGGDVFVLLNQFAPIDWT